MKLRTVGFSCLVAASIAAVGCAHEQDKHIARTPRAATYGVTSAPVSRTTSSSAQSMRASNGVSVSSDIMRACNIVIGNVDEAPRFDFDQSSLQDQDRQVLDQIGKCVTTGPLKGRKLLLTGRADPRGEEEYNMTLGEHRAGSVGEYLTGLGVDRSQISETSRGKLDATGTDETGWQRDRRVDISLQ